MATSKSFFGLRRGSTKSLTFQVYRGQQVTKDRVTNVRNPQSTQQMQQRLVLPLVANARSILSTLVNHSFEGVAYGEDSLKYFSSENLKKDALEISEYVPKGGSDSGLANFLISKGSLPTISIKPALMSGDATEAGTSGSDAFSIYQAGDDKDNKDALYQIIAGIIVSNATGNLDLASQLKKLAKLMGLEENDQLTFLSVYSGSRYSYPLATGSTGEAHFHRYLISRIVLGDDDVVNKPWVFLSNTAEDQSQGGDYKTVDITDGYTVIRFTKSSVIVFANSNQFKTQYTELEGATMITSRLINNVWRRSTNRIEFMKTKGRPTYDDVLFSYLKTVSASSKYLNSGVDGVDITGGQIATSENV